MARPNGVPLLLPLPHLALALSLALALAQLGAEARPDELYSDRYDHISAEDILSNDALRDEYYNCFMDKGPCVTEDAAYFKGNLAEAVATECKKCTTKQLENFEKVAIWYTANRPDEWTALMAKLIEDAKKMNIAGK